ncbi:MAG: chemotaxis protein CheC [Methanomicrobiaceae archaeon]|nr:chemotaxis protein CheC [Methanomicrobiaceae archaeon]
MELSAQQMDQLKELGNIGASHAATSLSQMLMSPIDMTVPEVMLIDISDIATHIRDEIAAIVIFEIQGEISPGGYVGLYMPRESAVRLTNTMLGTTDMDREFNEMDESALLEVGNIMISQFLDATATLLDIIMIPSPPDIAIDMAHAVFETILSQVASDINNVILFRTDLRSTVHEIRGAIILMPNCTTLNEILMLLERLMHG